MIAIPVTVTATLADFSLMAVSFIVALISQHRQSKECWQIFDLPEPWCWIARALLIWSSILLSSFCGTAISPMTFTNLICGSGRFSFFSKCCILWIMFRVQEESLLIKWTTPKLCLWVVHWWFSWLPSFLFGLYFKIFLSHLQKFASNYWFYCLGKFFLNRKNSLNYHKYSLTP